jgi:uncharacterized protein
MTPMDNPSSIPPITEDDIAHFLANTPGFFDRHAELLSSVQLTSPHSHRAVSLQERQAELLREKIRHLELKAAEMIRHGQDNVAIAAKLQRWTLQLLRVRTAATLPQAMVEGLQAEFQVPQAALRLWGLAAEFQDSPCTQGVSSEAQAFAASLSTPYCGANPGLEAVGWLADPEAAASIALIPLRAGPGEPVFGLLVLASSDARRFHASMGTDFLARLGELGAAALERLLPSQAG